MFCTVCLYLADIQHCADHTSTTQHCAICKPGTVTLTILDMYAAVCSRTLSDESVCMFCNTTQKPFETAGLLLFTGHVSFSQSNCIYNTPTEATLLEF